MKHRNPAEFRVLFALVLAAAGLLIAGSLPARTGAPAQAAPAAAKLTTTSIQIDLMDPGDLPIPPEFRVAVYENLVAQVEKANKFQHVYRSGNRNASSSADLVILKTTAEAYKKGSEKEREVTTVAGATSIKIKAQFTDRNGKVLLEKELEGKVRFFGGNLDATNDFAKKLFTFIGDTF